MAVAKLFFDPDEHPDQTLKAFEEFILDFSLRYEALYPDPPKVSLESAIQRWKYKQKTRCQSSLECTHQEGFTRTGSMPRRMKPLEKILLGRVL